MNILFRTLLIVFSSTLAVAQLTAGVTYPVAALNAEATAQINPGAPLVKDLKFTAGHQPSWIEAVNAQQSMYFGATQSSAAASSLLNVTQTAGDTGVSSMGSFLLTAGSTNNQAFPGGATAVAGASYVAQYVFALTDPTPYVLNISGSFFDAVYFLTTTDVPAVVIEQGFDNPYTSSGMLSAGTYSLQFTGSASLSVSGDALSPYQEKEGSFSFSLQLGEGNPPATVPDAGVTLGLLLTAFAGLVGLRRLLV